MAAAMAGFSSLRLHHGHTGDVKSFGDGVSELRIDYGPGYRLYFTRRGRIIVVLLCGGTKNTQQSDIRRAIEISKTGERLTDDNQTQGIFARNVLAL